MCVEGFFQLASSNHLATQLATTQRRVQLDSVKPYDVCHLERTHARMHCTAVVQRVQCAYTNYSRPYVSNCFQQSKSQLPRGDKTNKQTCRCYDSLLIGDLLPSIHSCTHLPGSDFLFSFLPHHHPWVSLKELRQINMKQMKNE